MRRRALNRTVRFRVAGQREVRRIPLGSHVWIAREQGYWDPHLHVSLYANGALHMSRLPAGWRLEIGCRVHLRGERGRARSELWLTLYAPIVVVVSVRPIPARAAYAMKARA